MRIRHASPAMRQFPMVQRGRDSLHIIQMFPRTIMAATMLSYWDLKKPQDLPAILPLTVRRRVAAVILITVPSLGLTHNEGLKALSKVKEHCER